MTLSTFPPVPNMRLLEEPERDAIFRRWLEQLEQRITPLNTGSVTSVNISGGTTGLTFSGGPVSTAGTITMAGKLGTANGGTGASSYANGQLLIGTSSGTLAVSSLTAGSGITVSNGSGNITIAANGSGTVTSVDVSGGTTGLTTSGGPITTSGTITLAGDLNATHGGTGFASYAVGDILYADTTTTLAKLADVATGNALISGGPGVAPSWGKIGLTTHVSGTLPISNISPDVFSFAAAY